MQIGSLCLRLLVAMLIGALIGGERESVHRPAGLRTHMLVSTGSAVVMMLGMYLTSVYSQTVNIDPSRLGAQVISGIGFLGAGTILREGLTIKGLTTAASLWVVACLGLAAGAGFYALALLGMVLIYVTLTVFERLQENMVRTHHTHFLLELECTDLAQCMIAVNETAKSYHLIFVNFDMKKQDEVYIIAFKIKCDMPRKTINEQELMSALCDSNCIQKLSLAPI